jgi:hypothetical protein
LVCAGCDEVTGWGVSAIGITSAVPAPQQTELTARLPIRIVTAWISNRSRSPPGIIRELLTTTSSGHPAQGGAQPGAVRDDD